MLGANVGFRHVVEQHAATVLHNEPVAESPRRPTFRHGVAIAAVALGLSVIVAVVAVRRGVDGRPDATRTGESGDLNGRLVFLRDNTLMEFDGTTTKPVMSIPGAAGFDWQVTSHGTHVMIQAGDIGYLLNASTWGKPIVVGPFLNNGVLLGDEGFWAADPLIAPSPKPGSLPDRPPEIVLRLHDWHGNATGRSVTVSPLNSSVESPERLIPVGVTDHGIVATRMNDSHTLLLTSDGVRDLGPGVAISTINQAIAVLRASQSAHGNPSLDRLTIYDLKSGKERARRVRDHGVQAGRAVLH